MKKRCMLGLLALALCMGQTCGAPPPIAEEAGQPIPQQGIPEGIYIGEVQSNPTLTFLSAEGAESESMTSTFTLTKEFGPSGTPLTAQDSPLAPGDFKHTDIGPGTGTSVVTSVSVDVNRVVVMWDEICNMTLPDLTVVTLTGSSKDIYEFAEPNMVSYLSIIDTASDVVDGGYLVWHNELSGILYR